METNATHQADLINGCHRGLKEDGWVTVQRDLGC